MDVTNGTLTSKMREHFKALEEECQKQSIDIEMALVMYKQESNEKEIFYTNLIKTLDSIKFSDKDYREICLEVLYFNYIYYKKNNRLPSRIEVEENLEKVQYKLLIIEALYEFFLVTLKLKFISKEWSNMKSLIRKYVKPWVEVWKCNKQNGRK